MVIEEVIDLRTIEAHACREALALTKALHVNKVSITADCARVVKEFQSSIQLGAYYSLQSFFTLHIGICRKSNFVKFDHI